MKLSKEAIDNLMVNVCRQEKDLNYSLRESKTTNSFYLRLYYKGKCKSLRISDHKSSKAMPSVTYVEWKAPLLEKFIKNNINQLKRNALKDLFDKIAGQEK